jgi:Na+/H+-dicarboxylate symporter
VNHGTPIAAIVIVARRAGETGVTPAGEFSEVSTLLNIHAVELVSGTLVLLKKLGTSVNILKVTDP